MNLHPSNTWICLECKVFHVSDNLPKCPRCGFLMDGIVSWGKRLSWMGWGGIVGLILSLSALTKNVSLLIWLAPLFALCLLDIIISAYIRKHKQNLKNVENKDNDD